MNKVGTLSIVFGLCALAIPLALTGGPLAAWVCLGIFLVLCFIPANMLEVIPSMSRRQDALEAMERLLGDLARLDRGFPNPFDYLLQGRKNLNADSRRTPKRQWVASGVNYIDLADEAYYSLFGDFRSLQFWVLVKGQWIPLYFHHRFPTRRDELLGIGLGPYSWSKRLPLSKAQLKALGPISERMVVWGLDQKHNLIRLIGV